MHKIIFYKTVRGEEPYIKHLDGDYVLLHSFVKKTQKTPRREILKAKAEFEDFKERNGA